MTGEMSRADLTEDGEWGLFVKTAKILKCQILPFDVYMGPFILFRRNKLWFSNSQEDEGDHGIYNDTTDSFLSLSEFNPFAFSHITPEQLADFIDKNIE